MDKNYVVRKGEDREGSSGGGWPFHMGLGAGQQTPSERGQLLSEKLIHQ